jgi:hypothetical protein
MNKVYLANSVTPLSILVMKILKKAIIKALRTVVIKFEHNFS